MARRIPHVKWLLAAALLAGGLALGHAGTPGTPPPVAPEPPPGAAVVPRSLEVQGGALVAPGKAPEVDILYTGDVIGYIDPCG